MTEAIGSQTLPSILMKKNLLLLNIVCLLLFNCDKLKPRKNENKNDENLLLGLSLINAANQIPCTNVTVSSKDLVINPPVNLCYKQTYTEGNTFVFLYFPETGTYTLDSYYKPGTSKRLNAILRTCDNPSTCIQEAESSSVNSKIIDTFIPSGTVATGKSFEITITEAKTYRLVQYLVSSTGPSIYICISGCPSTSSTDNYVSTKITKNK
ncbi:hypothetical protein [Leptospira kobayashii]|uniref:hypothetical protein n=1 Tax=Leptospira kobayashii TaxID=1917830 RepID=UPI00107FB08E|nr:hypothetical protein [Leptospira kobayashii]